VSWLSRLLNVFRAEKVSDEIERELAFHVDERVDELTAAGVAPDAARREARRRLGRYTLHLEDTRERDLFVWLESFVTDLRYGLRGLVRNPIFAIAAILTLAIGIGANTTVFTLLHGLLLRNLPVTAPQNLVRIDIAMRGESDPYSRLSYGMFRQFGELQQTLEGLSGWRQSFVTLEDRDGTSRQVTGALVTGNAFDLIGLRPRVGRLLAPSDDARGGPAEGWPVVLSDVFWRDRFDSDPQVVGKPIRIGSQIVTVVGVVPASFRGIWPGVEPKVYLPMQYLNVMAARDVLNVPQSRVSMTGIGRVKPDFSVRDVRADLMVHEQRVIAESTSVPPAGQATLFADQARRMYLVVESARTGVPSFFRAEYSASLYLMQGLVAIVLLLCCVNVSGLMLSKLHERQHEFAVRTALGAGGMRLARQYLTEASLVALAGAALGAATAWYGSPLLLPFFRHPMEGTGMQVQPDKTVFLATALSAIATTLFFGALPAWRAGRANPAGLMKARNAAQRPTAGRGFVAIQVALSLVLVVMASLLSQSLLRLQSEPTGFDLDQVTIQTAPIHVLSLTGDARLDVYDRMVERIARSSTIQSVAVTWYTPMTGQQSNGRFEAPGATASSNVVTLAFNSVGAGYFRTMNTTILQGREFEPRERRRDVCVLNESAARVLFAGQSALGRYVRTAENAGIDIVRGGSGGRLLSEPITCRVVGVAEDAKFGNLRDAPPKTIYFPLTPDLRDGNLVFLLNSRTKAGAIAAYREALREIAPAVPLVLFATLREQMEAALGSQRALTLLSTFFGVVALLLSGLGLYGMLSSSVSQRTAEIGIRAALGASRGSILRMIVSEALRLAAIGFLLGAAGLFFGMRFIERMLYGVSSFDWLTLTAVGVVLTAVILLASFWPARRAASVDPITAIHSD
jgi:predicted permease